MPERRNFFRRVARDALVLFSELRGQQHIRFDEVREFPVERIARMVPMHHGGLTLHWNDGTIRVTGPEETGLLCTIPDDGAAAFLIDRMDGETSLGEWAVQWAGEDGDRAAALEGLREAFFDLLERQICTSTSTGE